MQELKMGVASAEEETQAVMKVYSKEDYSVVNRFESEPPFSPLKQHTLCTTPLPPAKRIALHLRRTVPP